MRKLLKSNVKITFYKYKNKPIRKRFHIYFPHIRSENKQNLFAFNFKDIVYFSGIHGCGPMADKLMYIPNDDF